MIKFLIDNAHIILMCIIGLILAGSLGFMAYNYIGTEHWVAYGAGRSVVDLKVYQLCLLIWATNYMSYMFTRK